MSMVGALYRIRTICEGQNTGAKFSGIKIGHGRRWRLRLPPWETLRIPAFHYNYFNIYIGLDRRYVYQGVEYLHAIEAGVSVRGCEVHQLPECPYCPGGRPPPLGWHAFCNYTPKKQYPPFNDPDPYRNLTPISGLDITMELRVRKLEVIEGSNRFWVDLIINDNLECTYPLYGVGSDVNQFDVKIVVGGEMVEGSNPDDLAHGPVVIEYMQMAHADCPEPGLMWDKTWLPVKGRHLVVKDENLYFFAFPGFLQTEISGIEAKTAFNTLGGRDFIVTKNAENYFWTVELPPPE